MPNETAPNHTTLADRPPSQIEIVYARISDFVRRYGGTPPATDDSKSLLFLADFAFAGGFEWDLKAVPKESVQE